MRPDWDSYFLEITNVVKKRSTCLRRQVGALIVKNNHILATGYNGVPSKITHCSETGCLREQLNVPSGERHELCRGLHAEQNAIIQAAHHGTSIKDSTLYTNTKPCSICTKMIVNAGIKRIVFEEYYKDKLADNILSETDIILFNVNSDK
ncbi:CMP/dCMP deaminase zinc-binding protein [Flexistipes sinusarabici DSM 4947]|uniref:CMP/dCMP deaminase zinc-binding protein n=1 Tax=Flexistipes sinusarabici (strain ATCC 49648 / DSM 4947 / MAS 10) TaxID=717231 RepID=F8E893_FLESM|nr:cytidine/deoxycytidylate deaminase family protein [Flexistipes sinusarabici]AEI15090.1 CMP/dCMP deaminase zinc-binding protein [Flexistipes sinusarabici DSM 4947]